MSPHHNDFEKEPIPGIPARLPPGEELLWQGKPAASSLARTALHNRKFAVYFGALVIWRIAAGLADGAALSTLAFSVMGTVFLGAVLLALISFIARLMEKTTIYSITNKRVIMRFGIAIPITFQFPFTQITNADLKQNTDGTGSISFALKEHTKIVWPILWPHVRPWKLAKPQPTMRALPDVNHVTNLLAVQLRAAHGQILSQPAGIVTPTAPTETPIAIGGLATKSAT